MSDRKADVQTDWISGQQFARVPLAVLTDPRFRKLAAPAIRAYLTIVLHAGKDGNPWVSARRLQEIAAIAPMNVTSRGVGPLIDAGLLVKDGQHNGTTRYRLILPTVNNTVDVNTGVDAQGFERPQYCGHPVHAGVDTPVNSSVDAPVHSGVDVSYPSSYPSSDHRTEEGPPALAGADAPGFAFAAKIEKPAGSTSKGSDTSSANQFEDKQVAQDQTQPATAKAKTGQEKRTKSQPLTDDEKLLACRSADSMLRYLLWGAAGVRQADDAGLTPTGTNWRHAGRDHSKAEQQVATWSVQHFAAYYWWQVSKYRQRKGLPITMPDFGRLGKVMASYRANLTTWQLAQKIVVVCAHFDLIRFEMQWASPSLDEATMQHQKIMAKVIDIETSGENALTARYEKAFDAGYCQTVESERVETPAAASEPAATSAEVAATDSPVETTGTGAAETSPTQVYTALKMFQLPPITQVSKQSLSERAREAGLFGVGVGEPDESNEPVDDIDDAWDGEIEPPDYIEQDEEDAEADPVAA